MYINSIFSSVSCGRREKYTLNNNDSDLRKQEIETEKENAVQEQKDTSDIMQQSQDKINSANEERDNATQTLSTANENLSNANNQLSEANSKLSDAQAQLQAAQSIPIETIQNEDGTVTYDSHARDEAIAEAEKLIEEATTEQNEAKAQVEQYKTEIEEAKKAVEEAEAKIKEAESSLNELQDTFDNIDSIIQGYEQELNEINNNEDDNYTNEDILHIIESACAGTDKEELFSENPKAVSNYKDIIEQYVYNNGEIDSDSSEIKNLLSNLIESDSKIEVTGGYEEGYIYNFYSNDTKDVIKTNSDREIIGWLKYDENGNEYDYYNNEYKNSNANIKLSNYISGNDNLTIHTIIDGQVYEEINVNPHGEVQSLSRYDENGTTHQLPLEKENNQNSSNDREIVSDTTDAYGRTVIYSDNTMEHSSYDEKGRLTSILTSTTDNPYQYTSTERIEYYDNGGKTTIYTDIANGTKTETTLNANGEVISEINYKKNIQTGEYEIDTNNSMINDVNGIIEDSKQGPEGDCWLLSAVNSLSYTETGRQILSETIKETDDGYELNFRGVSDPIYVSKEELLEAKGSGAYSKGDTDMLLIELGIEKELVRNHERYERGFLNNITIDPQDPLKGNDSRVAFEIITGIPINDDEKRQWTIFPDQVYDEPNYKYDGIDELDKLGELMSNSDNYAAILSFYSSLKIKDINGEELLPNHGYSIKRIEGNNIVLVNPHNSSKEIIVNKDEFRTDYTNGQATINCIDLRDLYR